MTQLSYTRIINHNLEHFKESRALSSQTEVVHVIYYPELFEAFKAMGSQPRIVHIIHSPKLFIASKGLSKQYPKSFISSTTLSYW